ncbi:hypothetical protein [Sodalis sp. dw_96]|uniref:hypothetical protein n=1 Tax=Sodalis sp. dw_96 TaxID=2719794 RepID=UPI001BD41330|nr:hypothetical protein [Sodalis sp. dw_96]
MKKDIILNNLKINYIQILNEFYLNGDKDLSIDTNLDLDRELEKQISCLQDAVVLLGKTRDAEDEIATQAALVFIRVYAMRLSNFFEDIKDDADLLNSIPGWPEIPENYKIPEHYNFPHK